MQLRNDWLKNEEMNFRREYHTKRLRSLESGYLFRFMVLLLVCLGVLVATKAEANDCIECPYCRAAIELEVAPRIDKGFPDKWRCHKCGSENYEGMIWCGVCGEKRR